MGLWQFRDWKQLIQLPFTACPWLRSLPGRVCICTQCTPRAKNPHRIPIVNTLSVQKNSGKTKASLESHFKPLNKTTGWFLLLQGTIILLFLTCDSALGPCMYVQEAKGKLKKSSQQRLKHSWRLHSKRPFCLATALPSHAGETIVL